MTLSRIGRASMALVVSVAMGLGMTSCGGGTVGFLWVLGTKDGANGAGQIGGFKIDNYTGNLTGTVGAPYPSGGTNPVMLALKSGGRYLYVLNAGDTATPGNIALFSIGGDGVLSYQQSYTSQGSNPVWISTDTSGSFLYVLDQQSPNFGNGIDPTLPISSTNPADLNGSVTVFSLDPNTGRPSLITNAQVKNAQGTQLNYFEVGKNPTQFRNSASCLFTLDAGDQSVFPYVIAGGTGQLTQPTNSTIALNTANATSINLGGSYVYVTDAGSTVGGAGTILPYTQGSSCSLAPVNGGNTANLAPASYPIQTVTASGGGNNYLFVLNQSTVNTNYANSSISSFTILSNGQLQAVTPANESPNPSPVGSGPVCIAVDPTRQYIYTSNQISNSLTGYRFGAQYGNLSTLTRGSNFPTVGSPSCFVISGNTGQ
jgi:6-phosphogluconolactonase (cycloisomerase 2 family)